MFDFFRPKKPPEPPARLPSNAREPPESPPSQPPEPPTLQQRRQWENSPVYLSLLSQFLAAKRCDHRKLQDWSEPLREPVQLALDKLIASGLLRPAEGVDALVAIFDSGQLAQLLIDRRLPSSGTKKTQAKRLVEYDAAAAKELISGYAVLVCTEEGKVEAEAYKAAEDQRRKDAITRTQTQLNQGLYREAAISLANYEANCVFQRGINMSWGNYDPSTDEKMLRYIFQKTPKLFVNRNWGRFKDVRTIAGMTHLWGNAGNSNIECSIEEQSAAWSLVHHAKYLCELDDARELGYKYVRIDTCNDSTVCSACRKVARRKRYSLAEVPEIPIENCTEELGCRCDLSLSILAQ